MLWGFTEHKLGLATWSRYLAHIRWAHMVTPQQLPPGPSKIYFGKPFFIFIFFLKKTKFQKYMPNREIFKNGKMGACQGACRPSSWRQDLNVFRSWRPGRIKQ